MQILQEKTQVQIAAHQNRPGSVVVQSDQFWALNSQDAFTIDGKANGLITITEVKITLKGALFFTINREFALWDALPEILAYTCRLHKFSLIDDDVEIAIKGMPEINVETCIKKAKTIETKLRIGLLEEKLDREETEASTLQEYVQDAAQEVAKAHVSHDYVAHDYARSQADIRSVQLNSLTKIIEEDTEMLNRLKLILQELQ